MWPFHESSAKFSNITSKELIIHFDILSSISHNSINQFQPIFRQQFQEAQQNWTSQTKFKGKKCQRRAKQAKVRAATNPCRKNTDYCRNQTKITSSLQVAIQSAFDRVSFKNVKSNFSEYNPFINKSTIQYMAEPKPRNYLYG